VHDEINDPDAPKESIESRPPSPTVNVDLAALLAGTRLSDPAEFLDLDQGSGLRDTQAIIGYKGGFGLTAIVYDYEVPNWAIFRLRRDVMIDDDDLPNFMDRRRGGKAKKKGAKELWRAKDIRRVKGIAIAVPPGYAGNPEDLVDLIPHVSGTEKDRLKKAGERIPQQPDVQLLIEWTEGMMVETPKGVEEVFTSWESRSGCRSIWKKYSVADATLSRYAKFYEGNYRKFGGKHSSEERGLTPFDVPSAGSTPAVTPEPEGTPPPPPPVTPPTGTPPSPPTVAPPAGTPPSPSPVTPPTGTSPSTPSVTPPTGTPPSPPPPADTAKKTAFEEFKVDYLMGEGVETWAQLSSEQKGEGIYAFGAYYRKKLGAV
jgi:hypothetical protein